LPRSVNRRWPPRPPARPPTGARRSPGNSRPPPTATAVRTERPRRTAVGSGRQQASGAAIELGSVTRKAVSRSPGLANGVNLRSLRRDPSPRFRLFSAAPGRGHTAHRGGSRHGIGADHGIAAGIGRRRDRLSHLWRAWAPGAAPLLFPRPCSPRSSSAPTGVKTVSAAVLAPVAAWAGHCGVGAAHRCRQGGLLALVRSGS